MLRGLHRCSAQEGSEEEDALNEPFEPDAMPTGSADADFMPRKPPNNKDLNKAARRASLALANKPPAAAGPAAGFRTQSTGRRRQVSD
jgi:hypothetical protein